MKFLKIYLPIFVILVLCMALAGCRSNGSETKQVSTNENSEEQSNADDVSAEEVEATPEISEYTGVRFIMSDDEFKAEVLDYPGVVLVDVGAHWCPPCRMLAPHLDTLAEEMEGKLRIFKLYDDEKGAKVKSSYKKYVEKGIPTLVIFDSGEVAAKEIGYRDYATLKKWVEGFI